MKEGRNHVISVLFTRYYSTFSNFIYWISGRGYTHASIALDDENEYYYSFNYRGFAKEYPKKHKRRSSRSVCYRLEISDASYEKMKKKLEDLKRKEHQLAYCKIGVILCLMNVSFKFENRYFCSQFVAEMLKLDDSVLLKKDPALYLPNQLSLELGRQAVIKEIVYNGV